MNLSPEWAALLRSKGWSAEHRSAIGDGRAPDEEILRWAREHGAVMRTQDLDFPRILALPRAVGPSVVLLRLVDEFDTATRERTVAALERSRSDIETGAMMVIDHIRERVRLLPISPSE